LHCTRLDVQSRLDDLLQRAFQRRLTRDPLARQLHRIAKCVGVADGR